MDELSEAEREAMRRAVAFGVRAGRGISSEEVWLAARDYGREREDEHRRGAAYLEDRLERTEERERALRETLAEALEYVPDYFREKWDLDAALTASPQSDHGPGEPSEDEIERVRTAISQSRAQGPREGTGQRMRRYAVAAIKALREGESNG